MPELRTQQLTRFITPLREGGSLPALAEADDGFKYVVKLRGAGHGVKALVAELIGGEVARALKFKVPELIFANLDEKFGRTEPDEEVQELLRNSTGINIAMHFLSGAFTVDPLVNPPDADFASRLVWLDAFLTNVDRTVRNPNMLLWQREQWLIDHGASLMFHHSMTDPLKAAKSPFPYIKDHVYLPYASKLEEIDKEMRCRITPRTLSKIVDLLPDEWLSEESAYPGLSPNEVRDVYKSFLIERLANSNIFVNSARDERRKLI